MADTSNVVYYTMVTSVCDEIFLTHESAGVRKRRPATTTSATTSTKSAKATVNPTTGQGLCMCSYTVNPQAYALYLIWKELFTCAVTSCMNMEVLFSVPETFLIPILGFYNELSHQPHVFHV